jgi:hypothetical protein
MKDKKNSLGMLFSFWWAIWKERDRQIFDDKHLLTQHVATLAQEEITVHLTALGPTIG